MAQTRRLLPAIALVALFVTHLLSAQSHPSFSGVWKLSNERSQPARKGDVTLTIDHRDPAFTVDTKILRSSGEPRTAEQKYTTDGRQSTTTGADGDEFLTSAVWKGSDLLFTIEEHEDGRTIRSTETWSLIDSGAALQRVREYPDGSAKQTLIYLLQTSKLETIPTGRP